MSNWRDQNERDLGALPEPKDKKTQAMTQIDKKATRIDNYSNLFISIACFFIILVAGIAILPLFNKGDQSIQSQDSTKLEQENTKLELGSIEWKELKNQGLDTISQLPSLKPGEKLEQTDREKLRETFELFEKNKDKFKGQEELEAIFSEITRRYALALAGSGRNGVREGVEELEEIKQRLNENFEIENLPKNNAVAEEYKEVESLLNRMRKSLEDEN